MDSSRANGTRGPEKPNEPKSEARENSPRVANVEWFETQFLPLVKEFVKET